MSDFGKLGTGGKVPGHYAEENNAQVVVIPEDLGSPFEGTSLGHPDSFHTNPPSAFGVGKQS